MFAVLAMLVLAAAAVSAVLVLRGGDEPDSVTSGEVVTADVTVAGEPLPALPGAGEEDEGVRLAVPELAGVDLDGSPMAIVPDGQPRMIVFMAHWSPECQGMIPMILQWAGRADAPEDLEIVGVSTGVDQAKEHYPPKEWLRELGWTYPVLTDSAGNDAAEAFGLSEYPFIVIVDGDGLMKVRFSGVLEPDRFDALMRATLAN